MWNDKRRLLRDLTRAPTLVPFADDLVDVVLGVVRRPQEEYDHYYARLALRLDGRRLRAGLARCLTNDLENTRVRAAFLLDVLDHPEVPPTRARWRQWTTARDLPHRRGPAADALERDRIHAARRGRIDRGAPHPA